jgi:glycosyltransferase involved in cell wall biosynthesis
MKIAVYAINKNESHFIKRFCDSAKDADLIMIADTGSNDSSVVTARLNGAEVHNICISPWRFDKARDAALALLPKDIDICISLDIDEVLEPGWREEVEKLWKDGVTRLRYKFDWSCGIVFHAEKIHSRHGYFWHHACHEYIHPEPRTKEVWASTDKLLVRHLPDPTKSRSQYLDLLAVSVQEDPNCIRNAFYYARELVFNYKWQEGAEALENYLKRPDATYKYDRCYAMRLLGQCYSELGLDGLPWYRKACIEAPDTREPWIDLAKASYERSDWNECFYAAMSGLKILHKLEIYTTSAASWDYRLNDFAALSAYNLGLKEIAIEQGDLALKLDPENDRLKKNLDFYRS